MSAEVYVRCGVQRYHGEPVRLLVPVRRNVRGVRDSWKGLSPLVTFGSAPNLPVASESDVYLTVLPTVGVAAGVGDGLYDASWGSPGIGSTDHLPVTFRSGCGEEITLVDGVSLVVPCCAKLRETPAIVWKVFASDPHTEKRRARHFRRREREPLTPEGVAIATPVI